MNIKSIRTFIRVRDFGVSRSFYRDFGFEEIVLSEIMSYFRMGDFGFYLQDYYVKDWVENSMVFLEVENLESYLDHIKRLQLEESYEGVKISGIQYSDWGDEFFVHYPSGIIWHIGEFK